MSNDTIGNGWNGRTESAGDGSAAGEGLEPVVQVK